MAAWNKSTFSFFTPQSLLFEEIEVEVVAFRKLLVMVLLWVNLTGQRCSDSW